MSFKNTKYRLSIGISTTNKNPLSPLNSHKFTEKLLDFLNAKIYFELSHEKICGRETSHTDFPRIPNSVGLCALEGRGIVNLSRKALRKRAQSGHIALHKTRGQRLIGFGNRASARRNGTSRIAGSASFKINRQCR